MPVEIHHDQRLIFGETNPATRVCGLTLTCETCEQNGIKTDFLSPRVGLLVSRQDLRNRIQDAYEHDVYVHQEQGVVKLVLQLEPPQRHDDNYVK